MQRLRTVTSLDVSAVAGHHAMPAALLFIYLSVRLKIKFISNVCRLNFSEPCEAEVGQGTRLLVVVLLQQNTFREFTSAFFTDGSSQLVKLKPPGVYFSIL